MAKLRAAPGMGLIADYECLDMHGYLASFDITSSSDRLGFWPGICQKGDELEEAIGLKGAWIVRRIFSISGVKAVWVSPAEYNEPKSLDAVIVHREPDIFWEDIEDSIVSIIRDGTSMSTSDADEIQEEEVLSALDENQLQTLQEYYRGC